MKQPTEYLVPDYYPAFSCKMGACRTPCCEGWPISLSLNDYFRLLGVDCSPELRSKLDCAIHIKPHPTPDGYAELSPRYDGKCPLHMEDGRCALHAECGGDVLALVCRMYPRGVRNGRTRECSCANSCEAVPELLIDRDAPLTFVRLPLDFPVPEGRPPMYDLDTVGRSEEARLWMISLIQQRDLSLPERLVRLGVAMMETERAFQARDVRRVEALLSGQVTLQAPDLSAAGAVLADGLQTAIRMTEAFDRRSTSIRVYGEAVLGAFGGVDGEERYRQAQEKFSRLLPAWETWFEHLLANHMFFSQFPFQDRPASMKEEFLSLCAVYALVRFLCVGWVDTHPDRKAAVDAAAAAFRLIDHTEFDSFAGALLRSIGCEEPAPLCSLLMI